MRRVIHKLFWIWQLDKEEAWINEMASHGYSLEHAGRFSFEFDETEPDKYKYKTLFLKGSYNSEENVKYFRFLEEMRINVVSHIEYPGTCCVYTRGLSEDHPEGLEIYSDIDSKINCLKVSAGYMIFVSAFTLFAAVINILSALTPANMVWWLNLTCAVLVSVLCTASVIATVRIYMKIGKLRKEREIHE
ncbi:Protein of unknown function [Ruminococcaceae bacterium YRB3002]|nr:Protein of unknown function [Ruminococcaceae bacterium YRB3002]